MLFKSILYFYKIYVIEHIMYFEFNNNIYMYIYIAGLKDLAKLSPFHIKSKAHAEKEVTSEDE